MIKSILIENYKSIQKLKVEPGRLCVLIGENGSGKSNLLEAIAFSAAAAGNKLDNEFLASRGIRVTDPQLMRAGFDCDNISKNILMKFEFDDPDIPQAKFDLENNNEDYAEWSAIKTLVNVDEKNLEKNLEDHIERERVALVNMYKNNLEKNLEVRDKIRNLTNDFFFPDLLKFLIYSPENPSLRTFEKEGQIRPLGIKGEGLFKLLKFLSEKSPKKLKEIKEQLGLIGWFEDFDIPGGLGLGEQSIRIKDRYLDEKLACFDQKSANEGFLFLLFYFTLFISDMTPPFFAIDNVDAALNPKLCSRLVGEMAELAKKYGKQVILTTHNPAVLDGLNLDDDDQRLFILYRNKLGHTKIKRFIKPEPVDGVTPVKLSKVFLRGYIGGLPKGF